MADQPNPDQDLPTTENLPDPPRDPFEGTQTPEREEETHERDSKGLGTE